MKDLHENQWWHFLKPTQISNSKQYILPESHVNEDHKSNPRSFASWIMPRIWRYGFSNSFSLLLCIAKHNHIGNNLILNHNKKEKGMLRKLQREQTSRALKERVIVFISITHWNKLKRRKILTLWFVLLIRPHVRVLKTPKLAYDLENCNWKSSPEAKLYHVCHSSMIIIDHKSGIKEIIWMWRVISMQNWNINGLYFNRSFKQINKNNSTCWALTTRFWSMCWYFSGFSVIIRCNRKLLQH